MFFVTSGMHFDLATLLRDSSSYLRIPVILAVLLAARAAPTILYRYGLEKRDRLPFALYSATSLCCGLKQRVGRTRFHAQR